jgi:hypothetical protein
MGPYCVVNAGKWQCVPTRCHILAHSDVPRLQAAYPEATFIKTERCEACGGGGCSTGLSETLCKVLPGVIDKAAEIKLIHAAARRLSSRRAERRSRQIMRWRTPTNAVIGEGSYIRPPTGSPLVTWCACPGKCAVFPPGARSFPAGYDPNSVPGMPPGSWVRC